MSKYTNIEPLIKQFEETLTKNAFKAGHTHTYACFQEFYNMLTKLPTEEVKPIVHGYVIRCTGVEDDCYCECSVCGTHEVSADDRYCCECGARLDALPPNFAIKCNKCVYSCPTPKPNCPSFKRDPKDGGYYG